MQLLHGEVGRSNSLRPEGMQEETVLSEPKMSYPLREYGSESTKFSLSSKPGICWSEGKSFSNPKIAVSIMSSEVR